MQCFKTLTDYLQASSDKRLYQENTYGSVSESIIFERASDWLVAQVGDCVVMGVQGRLDHESNPTSSAPGTETSFSVFNKNSGSFVS